MILKIFFLNGQSCYATNKGRVTQKGRHINWTNQSTPCKDFVFVVFLAFNNVNINKCYILNEHATLVPSLSSIVQFKTPNFLIIIQFSFLAFKALATSIF
jgi:hypothetical protein